MRACSSSKSGVVLGLAFLAWVACKSDAEQSSGAAAGSSSKEAPDITATRVEVATVQASHPTLHMVRPGEVTGAREAHLASALGGFVEAVLIDTGQPVTKNQPLAYIDTSTHNAQAKLTKIEVEDAERELARLEKLGSSVAGARVDAARTRVERARAQHALSRTLQDRAVIRAPFAGVLVDLDIERGEVVAPGMPIARLIKLDPVHVAVSVADRDVAALQLGGSAQVTTAGTPEAIPGIIHRIQPAADMRTRTFLVEVEVPNPDHRLLPGMIAKVAFDQARSDSVIMMPQDFLVTRLDGNGVFVVTDDDIARWRPLELGTLIGTQIEVVSGLAIGESVVILGQRGLSDGDRVIVMRRGACCREGRVVYDSQESGSTETPGQTPGQTPDETPGQTPDETPDQPGTAKPAAKPAAPAEPAAADHQESRP